MKNKWIAYGLFSLLLQFGASGLIHSYLVHHDVLVLCHPEGKTHLHHFANPCGACAFTLQAVQPVFSLDNLRVPVFSTLVLRPPAHQVPLFRPERSLLLRAPPEA